MKLAVIKSENIEVYISFNNSIQANAQKLSEWEIGALTTSNHKMWQNILCRITCWRASRDTLKDDR